MESTRNSELHPEMQKHVFIFETGVGFEVHQKIRRQKFSLEVAKR